MKKPALLSACLFSVLLAACAARAPLPAHAPARVPADAEVLQLMHGAYVQGLALAVIDGGEVKSVRAWGMRDAARGLPLQTDTIMYGASVVKAAFAYMVLQLADEGRLDLDAPIERLLPKPLPAYDRKPYDFSALAGDARWKKLTPRILLTHASGLGNLRWVEPDGRLRFHFEPGDHYAYSGEGIAILQLVLEHGLGLDPEREMQRRVFDRFGMTRTSMRWREDFAANFANGYALDGSVLGHGKRTVVSAIGSMDTTIDDQAKLWAGVVRGDGLSPAVRAAMVQAWRPIHSAHQFPTLAPQEGKDAVNWPQQLAAGLGVVTFRDRSGSAWFKGGHDDGTGNMVLCLDSGQRCVVMLSNDVRAERIYPALAERVLGATDMPWNWEYDSIPAR